MSHFITLVFTKENGKSVEELLAPFDENIEYHINWKEGCWKVQHHAQTYGRIRVPAIYKSVMMK